MSERTTKPTTPADQAEIRDRLQLAQNLFDACDTYDDGKCGCKDAGDILKSIGEATLRLLDDLKDAHDSAEGSQYRPHTAAEVERFANEIEVWEEYVDGELIAWCSHWRPLDLYSQGRTADEAVEAMKEAIAGWVSVMNQTGHGRWGVRRSADRHYKTGVHLRPREVR